MALRVYNGSANDSIVYIDDITWKQRVIRPTQAAPGYGGLAPLIQKVAGGGLPFPLGL